MPQVAFRMPNPAMWDYDPETDTFVKEIPVDECLQAALRDPRLTAPYDFADLRLRLDRDPNYCSFTPSKFNGCDMELFLRMNINYATDPGEVSRLASGTAAHAGLEVNHPEIIGETTVVRYLDLGEIRVPITVKPDKVYPRLGLIHDDKTRGYLPVEKGEPKPVEITEELRRQLTVGAWAWADPAFTVKDRAVTVLPPALEITRGQVIYRDTKKQIHQEVPLIPFDELEVWMRGRVMDLMAVYDGEIPEAEANWRCNTCQVRQFCPAGPKPKTKRGKST